MVNPMATKVDFKHVREHGDFARVLAHYGIELHKDSTKPGQFKARCPFPRRPQAVDGSEHGEQTSSTASPAAQVATSSSSSATWTISAKTNCARRPSRPPSFPASPRA